MWEKTPPAQTAASAADAIAQLEPLLKERRHCSKFANRDRIPSAGSRALVRSCANCILGESRLLTWAAGNELDCRRSTRRHVVVRQRRGDAGRAGGKEGLPREALALGILNVATLLDDWRVQSTISADVGKRPPGVRLSTKFGKTLANCVSSSCSVRPE